MSFKAKTENKINKQAPSTAPQSLTLDPICPSSLPVAVATLHGKHSVTLGCNSSDDTRILIQPFSLTFNAGDDNDDDNRKDSVGHSTSSCKQKQSPEVGGFS